MTTRNRPEKALISLFLSAYDNDTWQGCGEEWLDEEPAKQQNRRVEILATRRSDGATLAIEHTLIQPYAVHKQESARFSTVYRAIQNDQTLIVRNRGVDVFVRSGTLAKGYDWKSISSIVHDWFRANVRTLPVGESHHIVVATGTPPIRLVIRIIEERDFDGDLKIGINTRQLRGDPLSSAIEKALKTKVGKLADTKADKRILLLERDEFALSEDLIAAKIEGKRHMIEKFDKIHEIWFAGTVPSFGASNYKRFSMYRKDRLSNSWLSIRDASAAVTVANSERFQRLVGCQLILANG